MMMIMVMLIKSKLENCLYCCLFNIFMLFHAFILFLEENAYESYDFMIYGSRFTIEGIKWFYNTIRFSQHCWEVPLFGL